MEKPPQFIREFSTEESPEERQKAAEAIRAKRAEHFAERRRTQAERQAASEREQALAKQLEAVHSLENEIAELSASGLGKILSYLHLRKLRADAVVGQRTYDELKQQQQIAEAAEQQAASEKLDSEETESPLQQAKTMLAEFYKEQKEKWAESEYAKEDITENFSEEHLASLSLDDYALLLQRFPGEMVAHVTRQGIRDHFGHIYHTGGVGEYADGFMKMIQDGRLRSPLGVHLVEGEKEQAIARFLHLDDKTKEGALADLAVLTGEEQQGEPGSYVDRMAIHFATEEVADCFYGAEKGNEIFIAYPSAHIASQYYFSGQLNKRDGGYHNDQWVWANEERGMDLNAGLVFIPEEARVDRKTGSRYEIDESGSPIKNSEYHQCFKRVVDSPDFYDFANQVMEITGKLNQNPDSPDLLPENQVLLKRLGPFRQRLEQDFGITDGRLQMAILDYHHLLELVAQKRSQEEGAESLFSFHSLDSIIERAMKDEGILYAEAKDAIGSKEFWEAYCAKNPAKRPSKIVYYKGSSPTEALYEWRNAQGIRKKTEDKDIGFSERRIERDTPQATAGLDRFKILAEKVIEDHFTQTESAS